MDAYSPGSMEITVSVPNGLVKGDNEIVVISGGIKITAAQKFNYTGVSIAGFSPGKGAPGTIVTITGSGFSAGYYSNFLVKVGTATATILSRTNEKILVKRLT